MSIRKQIDNLGYDVFNNSQTPNIESPNLTYQEILDDPLIVRSANIKKAVRTKNFSDTGPVYGITLEDSRPLSFEEMVNSGNMIAIASHRLAMAEGQFETVPYIYHGVYVMLGGDSHAIDPEEFGDESTKNIVIKQNYFCFVDETNLSRDMIIKKNSIVLVQILDENQRTGVITNVQNLNIDYVINATVNRSGDRLESARQLFKGQNYNFMSTGQE